MRQRLHFAYPLSFAVLPALFFAQSAPGMFTPADVLLTCLAILLSCTLVYGALVLLLRRVASGETVAFLVFALVLWFYGYADVYRRAMRLAPDVPWHALLLPVALGSILGGVIALERRPAVRWQLTKFLSLTGALLIAVNATSVAVAAGRDHMAMRTSRLASELAAPFPRAPGAVPSGGAPARDIFLLLLDEHADAPTVRAVTGADITPFVDSLRRLGFTIPPAVRNNYAHTTFSLPSLLNFSHLTGLTAEAGRESRDPALADHLLPWNRAVRFMRAQGYEVVFAPSQWWPATRHMEGSDREVVVWPRWRLTEWASRGLARRLEPHTLLAVGRAGHPADGDFIRRTITALERLPAGPRPRFVVAHILSPHEPFVFDRACRDVPTPPVPREGDAQQVQCTDRLVLGLVTGLIAQARVPPIILLQGDHGTGFLGFAGEASAAAVSSAQLRERFGAFGAYYLPAGGEAALAPTVTLVNLLPRIFNYYFDAGLPLGRDDLYVSVERAPFDFRRIDLTPAERATGSARLGLAAAQQKE